MLKGAERKLEKPLKEEVEEAGKEGLLREEEWLKPDELVEFIDPIRAYLYEIGRTPLLKKWEEKDLAHQVELVRYAERFPSLGSAALELKSLLPLVKATWRCLGLFSEGGLLYYFTHPQFQEILRSEYRPELI